jgi:hypothetical protein
VVAAVADRLHVEAGDADGRAHRQGDRRGPALDEEALLAADTLPAYFAAHLAPALGSLLDAAVAAGEIRAGVDPVDLLYGAKTYISCPSARVWRLRRLHPVKLQAMFAKSEGCLTGGGPE